MCFTESKAGGAGFTTAKSESQPAWMVETWCYTSSYPYVDETSCEGMVGVVPVDHNLKEALLRRGGNEDTA